jgi:hypothetical protein
MLPPQIAFLFQFGWVLLIELWASTVLGSIIDARTRFLSWSPLVGVLALTVCLPVVGALLYVFLRPRSTWRERRLRRRSLELLASVAGEELAPTGHRPRRGGAVAAAQPAPGALARRRFPARPARGGSPSFTPG